MHSISFFYFFYVLFESKEVALEQPFFTRPVVLLQAATTVTTPAWTNMLCFQESKQPVHDGCFLLDPPLPVRLRKVDDKAWGLDMVLKAVAGVCCSFRPPFSVILYTV